MDDIVKAIKKTKDYAHKYGQILNDKQLFIRLICPKPHSFFEIKGKGIKKSKNNEWVKKVKMAKDFWLKNVKKMIGIKMIGITGSVAAESAKRNDDIDLLIITKRNELWWWRLYLRVFIWWQRVPHRRFGKKEKKDEFCFNLWLDEDNLMIPKSKRNLKNATDLIMMKVIWEKDNIYQKFLEENKWVETFLATGYKERIKLNRKIDKRININRMEYLTKIFNKILYAAQYFYMFLRSGRFPKLKDVNEGQAFFHDNY